MASICPILYESERKHIVLNIPVEFNNAQACSCCIYKVPVNLWKVNSGAYTPQLIAIGPIHHKNKEFEPMEREKERYFQCFWSHYQPDAQKLLEGYKSWLEDREEEIRLSYSVRFPEYSKKEFVEIILFDAVFIMEHFLRLSSSKSDKNKNLGENDYMITKPWLRKSIFRDLILLENQIPMFVLTELYDKVVAADEKPKRSTFLDLAMKCLEIYHPKESASPKETNKFTLNCMPSCDHDCDANTSDESKASKENLEKPRHFTDMIRYFHFVENLAKPRHFTDLIRYFHLPLKFFDGEEKLGTCSVLKTATQLNEAGVTFEKDKHQEECLLDIKFEKKTFWRYFLCLSCLPKSPCFNCFKARFKIPQLKVDYSTECLFRNLISLEQCHYPNNPYICNYVSLIDSLIHTKDDVELLVEKEVISHDLGSHKELATMVNGLCKYVVVDRTCYHQIIKDLNTHYRNIWNRSMAALRLVYFRDPWRASSTLVGVAVLVFTIFNFCRIVRVLW